MTAAVPSVASSVQPSVAYARWVPSKDRRSAVAAPGRGTPSARTPRPRRSPARPRPSGSNPRTRPGRRRSSPPPSAPRAPARARGKLRPARTTARPSRPRPPSSPRRRRPARPPGFVTGRRSSPSATWCSSVPERRSKTISAPSVEATPTSPAAATKPALDSGGKTTSVPPPRHGVAQQRRRLLREHALRGDRDRRPQKP